MLTTRRTALLLLIFGLAVTSPSAIAQQVIATVPAGGGPIAAAVNPVTNKIYVVAVGGVTVIDGATYDTTSFAVGKNPVALAVNPVTNKIYDANFGDGSVTVIDGATLATTTFSVGLGSNAVAVNPVTNKIYVVNYCGNDPNCVVDGSVTVIDGATNSTVSVAVGINPYAAAVNPVTNKIYVANQCGDDPDCVSGTVTVIDGATNATTSVPAGSEPFGIAVNPVTNKIYVPNIGSNDVTLIDGATLSTSTVAVGFSPYAVAVNPVTNKIYVANADSDNVTVIDGATGSTANVPAGSEPFAVAVDPVTNKIYVANYAHHNQGTVTVIDGATLSNIVTLAVGTGPNAVVVNPVTNRTYVTNYLGNTVSVIAGANASALQFVPVTPCRVVDTRAVNGPFGGPGIPGGASRSFSIPQSNCGIPSTAAAYSLNVTVVPAGPLGYLTIWPSGEDQPVVSTMNSLDGRVKANAAIVPAGADGAISVYVTNPTQVVLDIDGYFAPVSGSTLAFYPLTPCRVADTRKPNGGLAGPSLQGQQARNFPVLEASSCHIPASAQAYSLNFTAVPRNGGALGYLTVWPAGQSQPLVSTLNDLTGTIVANAALVPAGTGGAISMYPSNDTDLVIDINGYFAPAGQGGMSLYPAAPCRVLDSRKAGGAFSGQLNPALDVVDSTCGPPSTAQAYVFNATVVPAGGLGYLTLWPDGEQQPVVSTLNALDRAIASNMAIVPANNGKIDAFASNPTQLILDISSYFAP